ncbi:MAG: replicative DNA helicase [Chloroflexi bacterium]|nr:replicative DNA helicase [Chloroflexota bacterium]
MPADRLPPQNNEAEQSVLGSLLIDPDAIFRVSSFLAAEDFYRESNQLIYAAILALHERRMPADMITVTDELGRLGQLDLAGGPPYLTELMNAVPTSAHVEFYGRIVERTGLMRRLIQASGQIAALAYEEEPAVDEVIHEAERLLFDVSDRRISKSLVPIGKIVSQYTDDLEELVKHPDSTLGVLTGFRRLDALLGGLQRSDLVIIAARPSMGKSSLATSMAVNAALNYNAGVALFTLEMSAEQVVQRMLSSLSGIDSQDLRKGIVTGTQWERITQDSRALSEARIYIDDTPSPSPTEIRTKARRLAAEIQLDLVIIDYMQLMQAGERRSENRVQEVSFISRSLKGLARELKVPVVALSQLSRAVEGRDDRRPQLSDLRESGAIEQDADVVMFIYREDQYKKDKNAPDTNIAEIIIAKHRNGPTATVKLYFDKQLTRFADLATEEIEEMGMGDGDYVT